MAVKRESIKISAGSKLDKKPIFLTEEALRVAIFYNLSTKLVEKILDAEDLTFKTDFGIWFRAVVEEFSDQIVIVDFDRGVE